MIRVVVGDLAAVSADAIVRPVTTRLTAVTPAGERLDQAGGPAFRRALELRTDLAVGAAVVTPGGELPAEFVIHAVVGDIPASVLPLHLARAWRSVLERAKEWQFGHIAAPPMHVGSDALRLADVAVAMAGALRAHAAANDFPTAVSFIVESEDERAVFSAALRLGEESRP